MKPYLIRLSIISAIVVPGLIAIAYAGRGGGSGESKETDKTPVAAASGVPAATPAATTDPFAALRGQNETASPTIRRVNDAFDRDASAGAAVAGDAPAGNPNDNRQSPPPFSRETAPSENNFNPPADSSLPGDRYRASGFGQSGDRYGFSQEGQSAQSAQSPVEQEPAQRNPLRGGARSFDQRLASEPQSSPEREPQFPAQGSQRFSVEATAEPAQLGADHGSPPRRMSSADLETPLGVMPLSAKHTALVDGSGRPGNKELEGAQTPSLTIEKFAPDEIQIGKPATFEILVKNVGQAAAQNVTIHDQVPKGTRLNSTNPPADRTQTGEIVFALGTIEPGDEKLVKIELIPLEEGEVGSVATVHFAAQSSVRTVATRPELQLDVTAAKDVMIGRDISLLIKISNPGTGPATGIVIRDVLPENLAHTAGNELEYEVGDLKPGESRELELVLSAAKAGLGANTLVARGDGNLKAEKRTEIEVVAPGLEVTVEGPRRRFLERPATYTVSVSNPGTAAAKEVELVAYLPKGMDFVKADNFGQFDSQTRSVRWSLAELPAKESGSVTLTAVPLEAGERKFIVEAEAQQNLAAKKEHDVLVEGVAAIVFQVIDVEDPVEAGGQTTYEIHVINQGSKAATEIQLEALIPEGMKALSAEGPARFALEGGRVLFESLPRLAPKADTTYRIRVQCQQAGDMRLRVRLQTKEMTTPVTKEESTRVFPAE